MKNRKEMTEVFNINKPGQSSFVQKDKFDEVKRVLKDFMPQESPGLTQAEMAKLVEDKISDSVFEDRTKSGWWMKTVQLDLEARGVVVREKTKPARWFYDRSGKEKKPVSEGKREPVRREENQMTEEIRDALIRNHLMNEYRERPFYQRNDYIGWITGAKRDATKEKRINQMLEELKSGDKYMNMPYGRSNR